MQGREKSLLLKKNESTWKCTFPTSECLVSDRRLLFFVHGGVRGNIVLWPLIARLWRQRGITKTYHATQYHVPVLSNVNKNMTCMTKKK